MPHGQAVAIGLVWAARLAARIGVLSDADLPRRVIALLAGIGLPTDGRDLPPSVAPDDVVGAMAADKKRMGGRLRFVLPVAVADVRLFSDVAAADVRTIVAEGLVRGTSA